MCAQEERPDGILPLDEVTPRDRRYKDAKITVQQPAMGYWTVRATQELSKAGVEGRVGHPKPTGLQAGEPLPDKSVPLFPVREGAPHRIPVEYDGQRARTNLIRLFTLLDIVIPAGTYMEIPVVFDRHEVYGPCVRLLIAEARYRSVNEREGAVAQDGMD